MNLPFLFFLLSFLGSTGWCHALGNSGNACPEETCFSSNRETCSSGSSECGSCFQGFIEIRGECIPIESNSNDDSWENELEGTDGSDLNALFETPITPTEKPRKTEKYQHSSYSSLPYSDFSTPSAPATAVEENTNELNDNKDDDLGSKVAAKDAEKSLHQSSDETKTEHSNDLKAKELNTREKESQLKQNLQLSKKQQKKEELELLREKHKKLDEDKLNNFLSKKQQREDGNRLNDKIISSEDGANLESNSSTNPPPFIRKHKVSKPDDSKASEMDDIYFLFIVIGCSVAGIAGLGLAGYCWYKLHTTAKAVSEAEYSGFGMKGPSKRPPSLHGDEKLDYNAEMYHYHQTKSQLTAMEKAGSKTSKQGSMEDDENSDEGDEGDYTVYECPGLAPTGDMTVVNPLFSDQEAVGSDQDANGNRSGQSSPSSSRHSSTVKPAE